MSAPTANPELKVVLKNPRPITVAVLTNTEGHIDPDGQRYYGFNDYYEKLKEWVNHGIVITDVDTYLESPVFKHTTGVLIVTTTDKEYKGTNKQTRAGDKPQWVYYVADFEQAMLVAFRLDGTGFKSDMIRVFGDSHVTQAALKVADFVALSMVHRNEKSTKPFEDVPLELDLRGYVEKPLRPTFFAMFMPPEERLSTKIDPENGVPYASFSRHAFSRKESQ